MDAKYDVAEIEILPKRGRPSKAREALVIMKTDLSQFL